MCFWIDELWCIFIWAKITEGRFTRNPDSCRLNWHPKQYLSQHFWNILRATELCTRKSRIENCWSNHGSHTFAHSLPKLGFINQVHPDFVNVQLMTCRTQSSKQCTAARACDNTSRLPEKGTPREICPVLGWLPWNLPWRHGHAGFKINKHSFYHISKEKRNNYAGSEHHSPHQVRKRSHFGTEYHKAPPPWKGKEISMRIKRVAGLAWNRLLMKVNNSTGKGTSGMDKFR